MSFKYTDAGLLDRSHLRFFTKKEIVKMFNDEKFDVIDLIPLYDGGQSTGYKDKLFTYLNSSRLLWYLSSLEIFFLFFLDSSFYARQYVIKAKKEKSEIAAITAHF